MSSGGGWWVSAQLALVGGRGRGGDMAPQPWSPAWCHRVLYVHAPLSWSGWVDPGILLLLLTGPRSSSLMTSWVPGSLAYCCLFLAVVHGRCNRQGPITKSPSEGETCCNTTNLTHNYISPPQRPKYLCLSPSPNNFLRHICKYCKLGPFDSSKQWWCTIVLFYKGSDEIVQTAHGVKPLKK